MRSMDLVWLACLRAYLGTLKPKKRLAYLKAVSDIIGDPAVVPFMDAVAAREISEARAAWARYAPALVDEPDEDIRRLRSI